MSVAIVVALLVLSVGGAFIACRRWHHQRMQRRRMQILAVTQSIQARSAAFNTILRISLAEQSAVRRMRELYNDRNQRWWGQ